MHICIQILCIFPIYFCVIKIGYRIEGSEFHVQTKWFFVFFRIFYRISIINIVHVWTKMFDLNWSQSVKKFDRALTWYVCVVILVYVDRFSFYS